MDYGNTQEISSVDVVPLKSLVESVFRQNNSTLVEEVTRMVEFPLQAIRCQLKEKRDSIHNKEILKDLIESTECFSLRVLSSLVNDDFGRKVEIIWNTVELYADGKLLNECFEGTGVVGEKNEAVKRVELNEKLLEIGSEHKFTVSFVSEKELCFNLKSDVEKLEGLQKDINNPEVTGPLKACNNLNELKVNDVVLAKFYEEDRSTFNWYRARIQAINDDKITAFYLGMSSFIV